MTDDVVIPEIERTLVRAAEDAPARTRPRIVPILAGAVAGLAVAGTAAALVGSFPGLGTTHPAGPPEVSTSPVPRQQQREFHVLARDQRRVDIGPRVQKTIRYINQNDVGGFRPASVRYLAAAPGGAATILFSVERSYVYSSGIQQPTTVYRDPICLMRPIHAEAHGTAPLTCFPMGHRLRGPRPFLGFVSNEGGPQITRAQGLVPDGIDRVRLTTGKGDRITVRVRNNYWQTNKANVRRVDPAR